MDTRRPAPRPSTFAFLDSARSRLDQQVTVGSRFDEASSLRLTPSQRSSHLYCAGITGAGKTRWLQHLIFSDIAVGRPVVVLDPFGGLYRAVREFVATGIEQSIALGFDGRELLKRYRFLDLSDDQNPLQVNPLAPHPLESEEEQVDDLMKALERLLGGSLEEQRKLRNVLRSCFFLIASLNRLPAHLLPSFLQDHLPLTARFTADILNMPDRQRQLLLNLTKAEDAQSVYQLQYWRFVGGLSPHERNSLVQSSWNVLQFLGADGVSERFFGQVTTLDIPGMLRDGSSLIAYLPINANLAGARLAGKYLNTKVQNCAYRRAPEDRQPLHLFLDEFHQWSDASLVDALTNLRQFGVSVACAHQSQSQPPFDTREGQALLRAIQANSRLKAIFRLARPDAEDLVRDLFELSQQKPNFTTTDHTVGSSSSQARQQGTARTSGHGVRTTASNTRSQRREQGEDFGTKHGHADQQSTQQGTSTENSVRDQRSETITAGNNESATRRKIYYTIEGERELLVNTLQRLPQRQFYFSAEPLHGELLEAPFVPDELYHYTAVDLPAELMEWQRAELAPLLKAPELQLEPPTQRELDFPPLPQQQVQPKPAPSPTADVVQKPRGEKERSAVKSDPDDPFLD